MTLLTGPGASAGHVTTATAPAREESQQTPALTHDDALQNDRPETSDRFETAGAPGAVETRISVDRGTNRMVVRIVDATTEETIREIPPEKIRELSNYLAQYLGLGMDERA